MRLSIVGILAMACGLFVHGVLSLAAAKPSDTRSRTGKPSRPAYPSPQWQRFTSTRGRFSILFPDSPKKVEYQPQALDDKSATIHHFRLRSRIGGSVAAFSINYFDNTPLPTKLKEQDAYLVLDESWKSFYGRFKDRTIYKRRIKVAGHPCIEHRLWLPTQEGGPDKKIILTGSYILVGKRVYHLLATMPEPLMKAGHSVRFLSSFKSL